MSADSPTPGPDPAPKAAPGIVRRVLRRARDAAAEDLRTRAGAARDAARRAWSARPSPRRGIAIAFAAALVAAGAGGILWQARLPGRLPSALDWAALSALLERDARPGDAVAVAPAWAERARLAAPARVPVLAQARFDRAELTGVRRVWLVALPGAPGRASWLDAELDLIARAARPAERMALGRLEVQRFELAGPRVPLAFLPDLLARAEVRRGDQPCPAGADGAPACPGEPGPSVRRSVRQVEALPRPCLVAAPADAPLVISFPSVPLGSALAGHLGRAGDPPPPTTGALPARVALRVDEQEAGTVELPLAGWRAFRLDTARFAGSAREVELTLTAPAEAGALCLDAEALP
ncbi:conserved hypothetical protein [Anaeromyxobacter dehalogenans 2CP-1]|uniref:Uncharacterized protein n=1 Tax=Anaeromyxobacter dehalogenans (strain ATCC BAA-258 / DSM 21875 / 2CP-1) TaxID=455488 RepID=B8JFJ8_ANAD2|nr:hypothetical protein [Anaeromyxobacter dehalogenans]ACL66375.1 conserved hypothetical protein [Anaeromyxobacter dehalogenans 2CP-1]